MQRKTDKRTINTKRKIKDAITTLLLNDQKCTVTNIARLANINRNTFYIHYSSVPKAKKEMEKEVCRYIIKNLSKYEIQEYLNSPELLIDNITILLVKDTTYSSIIFNEKFSKNLTTMIINETVYHLTKEYIKRLRNMNEAYYYSIKFLISGYIYTLQDYIVSKKPISLAFIMDRIKEIANKGI